MLNKATSLNSSLYKITCSITRRRNMKTCTLKIIGLQLSLTCVLLIILARLVLVVCRVTMRPEFPGRVFFRSTLPSPIADNVNWQRIMSRPPYPVASLDIKHIGSYSTHAHDFQSPDNIIMVHSTDQRTIAESNGSEPPTLKTFTVKTVETYNRNQNTVRKLTTRSVDGVLESKQTVVTDIGKTPPLFGSQINLRRDKNRSTPGSGSRTPQKHTEISKVPSRLFPKTKDINKEEFAKDCLDAHNEYRAKHKSPPLKLSSQLCTFSQEWAEHLASILKMQHHPNNKYGENLYMFMTTDPNHRVKGRDAVDNWYQSEIEKYRFGEEPSDLEAGHLTQVLWEGSDILGVGVARNGYYTFVVCSYNPPGNYKGEYAENVPPVNGWRDEKTGELVVRSPKKRAESHETFVKEMLKLHNECRSKHGAGNLVLSKSLNDHAQSWANNLAEKGLFLHRPNNYFGENLFWSSEIVYAKDVVETWYAEHALYKYNVEPFKSGATLNCGHFSQMVWKETKQLGIGLAKGKNGAFYVVANYSPRGNIINRFTSNVLPPKIKSTK